MTELPPPRIRVDADACPGPIRDILFRAAERARVQVTPVANQWLSTPGSRFIRALQVQGGYDVADDAIAERLSIRNFRKSCAARACRPAGSASAMRSSHGWKTMTPASRRRRHIETRCRARRTWKTP